MMKKNRFVKSIMVGTFCTCLAIGMTCAMTTAQAATTEVQSTEHKTIDRLYGIGSVSKVFTAAAVMKLVDEGKIDLDSPITKYISGFSMKDPRYAYITPRMLLNHSAGLMGMTDTNTMLYGDNDTYNHDNFLTMLRIQHLKHNPGELSVYSNDSFTLAEILVEKVSGMSFTEFLEKNFFGPMDLENIKTPQSDFDRQLLAPVYFNGKEMKAENTNLIGSGGLYSSMEDLCRFGEVFMSSADGDILSKTATNEMAKLQHKKSMVGAEADTTLRYGLGWDSVENYPFNTLGIKALSKGGSTVGYHTNLTVVPEYNLSVAVSSSGSAGEEEIIAQEIILAVLQEEGLIDPVSLELPEYDTTKTEIPQNIKEYAGMYDMGKMGGPISVAFTKDTMVLTTIGKENQKQQEYIHNKNDQFVSSSGDYILMGFNSNVGGTRGSSALSFTTDEKGQKFILGATHVNKSGLGQTAITIPVAQKIEIKALPNDVIAAWKEREGKKYFLVSETYSSSKYLNFAVMKTILDNRLPNYVMMDAYQNHGAFEFSSVIADRDTALAFQQTPTMVGRDSLDTKFYKQGGIEVLDNGSYRYIEESAMKNTADIQGAVRTQSDGVWYGTNGETWRVQVPENSGYFVYDEKYNCIATSLEASKSDTISLPQNGYIVFVGKNAEFLIEKK